MKAVNPTRESISGLAGITGDTPIVMVNLPRSRDRAAYPPGSSFEECTGRRACKRYIEQAASVHREAAQEDSRLIATAEIMTGLGWCGMPRSR